MSAMRLHRRFMRDLPKLRQAHHAVRADPLIGLELLPAVIDVADDDGIELLQHLVRFFGETSSPRAISLKQAQHRNLVGRDVEARLIVAAQRRRCRAARSDGGPSG